MRHGYALRMNLGDPAFANGTADAVRAMQSRELAEAVRSSPSHRAGTGRIPPHLRRE
jgi:hypothetical protein